MASKAMQKMIQARSELLLSDCFFWHLCVELKLQEDPSCDTAWTDGKHLGYNPQYVQEQSFAELIGLLCEEVMHNGQGHPWRRGGREHREWNICCDLSLMPMIIGSGKKVSKDSCYDPQYAGKSPEEIYAIRARARRQQQEQEEQKQQNKQGGGGGQGNQPQPQAKPKPCSGGEVRDYKGPDKAEQQVKWQQAVLRAAQIVKMQKGKLPAFVEQLVEEIKNPAIDWMAALRRFFETCAANDYSWRFPNKRYLAAGLYMPSLRSEQMGAVVLLWDTSGSMDDKENRAIIAGECKSIIEEVKPEKTYVIYTDTKVHRVDEFERDQEIKFNPIGGGGTDFCKAFERIEAEGWQPACFIGISDLYATLPEQAPAYPVIWACTTTKKAEFGETLEVRL